MSWGPEKMLIRCSKESQHPAEWTPTSREQERHNVDGHKSGGQNIEVSIRSPAPSHSKTLHNLSNPYNKVRGTYFVKEVFLHASLSLRQ